MPSLTENEYFHVGDEHFWKGYYSEENDNFFYYHHVHGTWSSLGRMTEAEFEEQYGTPNNKEKKEIMVSKLLSMCLLVSSSEFAKQTPAKQTEILTGAGGKPVVFVNNFSELKNRNALIKKLLAGENVAMELEFNEVELTEDETKLFSAIQPVIERINESLKASYEWVSPAASMTHWSLTNSSAQNPAGYRISKGQCKKVWEEASKYWADTSGAATPASRSITTSGWGSRQLKINRNEVNIGCQTITRAEVEAVAKHFNFDPVMPE